MLRHDSGDGWVIFILLHPILVDKEAQRRPAVTEKVRLCSEKTCLPPRRQLDALSFCMLLVLGVQLETPFFAVGSKFKISLRQGTAGVWSVSV